MPKALTADLLFKVFIMKPLCVSGTKLIYFQVYLFPVCQSTLSPAARLFQSRMISRPLKIPGNL